MGGVELETPQYARYKEISGKLLADSLSQMFNNKQFMALDKYQKQEAVKNVVGKVRSAATKQLTMELYQTNPDFARKWYNAYLEQHGMQEAIGYKQK